MTLQFYAYQIVEQPLICWYWNAVSRELEDFFSSDTGQRWVPLLLDTIFMC